MSSCISPIRLAEAVIDSQLVSSECLALLYSDPPLFGLTLSNYLYYFTLTLALETPIYAFVAIRKSIKIPTLFFQILLLNLCTHPVVVLLGPQLANSLQVNYLYYIIFAESFAPLVEALLLWRVYRYSLLQSVVTAVLANLFSWWAGSWI